MKTANYIRQLEEKNANTERAMMESSRKSGHDEEKYHALKAEIDKERRKSHSL